MPNATINPVPLGLDYMPLWSSTCEEFEKTRDAALIAKRFYRIRDELFAPGLAEPARVRMFNGRKTDHFIDYIVVRVLFQAMQREDDARSIYLSCQYMMKIVRRMFNAHAERKFLPPICYAVENEVNRLVEHVGSLGGHSSGPPRSLKEIFARLGDAELWFACYYCWKALKLHDCHRKEMEEILQQRGFPDLHRGRRAGLTPLLKHLQAKSARAQKILRQHPPSTEEEKEKQFWRRAEYSFYMTFSEFLVGRMPGEKPGNTELGDGTAPAPLPSPPRPDNNRPIGIEHRHSVPLIGRKRGNVPVSDPDDAGLPPTRKLRLNSHAPQS